MAEWTPARKHGFIVAVLRAGTRRWPPKFNALDKAKTEKKINEKTKRLAQHYLCAMCEKEFTSKDIQVDHVVPVVDPQTGFTSWNDYIPRLFCGEDNLQVLCVSFNKEKTKLEKVTTKEEKSEAGRKSKRR